MNRKKFWTSRNEQGKIGHPISVDIELISIKLRIFNNPIKTIFFNNYEKN